MKKIISILVIVTLLATCALITVPASALDNLVIDWSKLDYTVFNENGMELDESEVLNNFNVTKTSDTLGLDRTGGGIQSNSYIAKAQFTITSTTKYTYEVMAKNNNTQKYSGVPFAISPSGEVYFIYGSFDNNNDTTDAQSGKSYVISARGDFDYKYPNLAKDETDARYFAKLQQTNGFASFKFEYEGLNVTIYGKADGSGNYVKIGDVVPLAEGSKIAIGVFSRDNSNGGNRTTTVKNGKITANNPESVGYLVITGSNGSSELKSEIVKAKQYPEADYTADSYAPLKAAITAAEAVANDTASAEDVASALATLKSAVDGLKLKEVDKAALEAAIAKAEALKEIEYTPFTFNMVKSAIEEAKALLADTTATQSKLDEMVATIEARIADLKPSGLTSEDEEEATDAPTTDAPTTDAPTVGDSTVQIPAYTDNAGAEAAAKKGCGSAVATTAVVVGLVATLGTALVVKKKD